MNNQFVTYFMKITDNSVVIEKLSVSRILTERIRIYSNNFDTDQISSNVYI